MVSAISTESRRIQFEVSDSSEAGFSVGSRSVSKRLISASMRSISLRIRSDCSLNRFNLFSIRAG